MDNHDDGSVQMHGTQIPEHSANGAGGFEPYGDRLLIEPIKIELVGGLELPDRIAYTNDKGIVRAAGPGRILDATGQLLPVRTPVGAMVVFSEFNATKLTLGKGEHARNFYVVPESGVMGVLCGDAEQLASEVQEVIQEEWAEHKVGLLRQGIEQSKDARRKGTVYSIPNGVPSGNGGLVTP